MVNAFHESVREFRNLMGSRSYWEKTKPENREGAKKALILSYLRDSDVNEADRESEYLHGALMEHDRREAMTLHLRIQDAVHAQA